MTPPNPVGCTPSSLGGLSPPCRSTVTWTQTGEDGQWVPRQTTTYCDLSGAMYYHHFLFLLTVIKICGGLVLEMIHKLIYLSFLHCNYNSDISHPLFNTLQRKICFISLILINLVPSYMLWPNTCRKIDFFCVIFSPSAFFWDSFIHIFWRPISAGLYFPLGVSKKTWWYCKLLQALGSLQGGLWKSWWGILVRYVLSLSLFLCSSTEWVGRASASVSDHC